MSFVRLIFCNCRSILGHTSILVYPPSGIGAVNITAGDLRRLEPSEFLNDSVIEFGLK